MIFFSGCYHPPYNDFEKYNRAYIPTIEGAALGTIAGAAAGGQVLVGTAVGALVGAGVGLYKGGNSHIVRDLLMHQVEFIEYGDTLTLVVPTDIYYMFNSPHFKPSCYPTLETIAKLIKMYPKCPIYVAGFTNSIGSSYHKKKLTQARAEAMITFLWANHINASRLNAEGYGDKYTVGNNKLIHGSAYNRRIEIQWFKHCKPNIKAPIFLGYVK